MTRNKRQYWDEVYASKADDELSWFQSGPHTSVRLAGMATHRRCDASVVDIGGGTSTLVDALLETSPDVTVLDISSEALASSVRRLGSRADAVAWVQADLLDWQPGRTFDVWHDRAVFHFLATAEEIAAYVDLASQAVARRGALILGVFALDGPTACSGLPTSRYDAEALAAHFAEGFDLEHQEREMHRTPAGDTQAFTWVILRRRSADTAATTAQ